MHYLNLRHWQESAWVEHYRFSGFPIYGYFEVVHIKVQLCFAEWYIEPIEVVSKPQIRSEGKAQVDPPSPKGYGGTREKAEHIQ